MLLSQFLKEFDLQEPTALELKSKEDVIDYYATQISMVKTKKKR